MSVNYTVSIDERLEWVVAYLEEAIKLLRRGLLRKQLSQDAQRKLLDSLCRSERIVSEAVGALAAYRACAMSGWPVAQNPSPPTDEQEPATS